MTRVLGLDPGDVRVGVALSDPTGTIASPYASIDVRTEHVVDTVRAIVADHGVATVVIGLPLRLDGTEGPAAERSRSLGSDLAGIGVDVEYWDERFTTVTAERALIEAGVRRAERTTARDPVAAAVMLQGYLDRRRHHEQVTDERHGYDSDGA